MSIIKHQAFFHPDYWVSIHKAYINDDVLRQAYLPVIVLRTRKTPRLSQRAVKVSILCWLDSPISCALCMAVKVGVACCLSSNGTIAEHLIIVEGVLPRLLKVITRFQPPVLCHLISSKLELHKAKRNTRSTHGWSKSNCHFLLQLTIHLVQLKLWNTSVHY